MKNTQRGITLIALVVTIVVLLILAGITIAFVLSDGGIFQAAKDAKEEQAVAAIRDYVGQINGVVATRYWSLVASGETSPEIQLVKDDEATKPEGKVDNKKISAQGFFPKNADVTTDYTVTSVTEDAKTSDGMIKAGSFDLTIKGSTKTYTVTFNTNGAVTVAPKAAE